MPPKRKRDDGKPRLAINPVAQPGEAPPIPVYFDSSDEIDIPEFNIPDNPDSEQDIITDDAGYEVVPIRSTSSEEQEDQPNEPSPKCRRIDTDTQDNDCQQQINQLKQHISQQDDLNFRRFLILGFCFTNQLSLLLIDAEGDKFNHQNQELQKLFNQFLKLKEGDEDIAVHNAEQQGYYQIGYDSLQLLTKQWTDQQEERSSKSLSCKNPENPLVVDVKILREKDYQFDQIFWAQLLFYFFNSRKYKDYNEITEEVYSVKLNNLDDFLKLVDLEDEGLQTNYPWCYEISTWLMNPYDSDDPNSLDRLSVFINDWNHKNDCIPYVKKYYEQIRDKTDVPQEFIDFINRGNFLKFIFSHFFL